MATYATHPSRHFKYYLLNVPSTDVEAQSQNTCHLPKVTMVVREMEMDLSPGTLVAEPLLLAIT